MIQFEVVKKRGHTSTRVLIHRGESVCVFTKGADTAAHRDTCPVCRGTHCETMRREKRRSKSSLIVLRVFNCVWRVSCTIGFIWCAVLESQSYFTFPTTTKTGPITPSRVYLPHVTLCYSLQSLIYGPVEHFFTDDGSEDNYLNQTVDQLLSHTPRDNETLTSCVYRDFQYNTFTGVYTGEQCVPKFFTVSRFRMQGYCCYRYFLSNHPHMINLFDLAYGWNYPQIIYALSISYPLNSGHKLCPIVHLENEAYDHRRFNQELVLSINVKQAYELTFNVLHIERLPSPYDTHCIDISSGACEVLCSQNAFARYGLTPLSTVTDVNNTHLILPNFKDTYNGHKLSHIILESKSECQRKCIHSKCSEILTDTLVTNPFPSINGEKLTVYSTLR